jgi:hypothetical protein
MSESDSAAGAHSEKRQAQRLFRRFILRVAPFGDTPLRWSHVTIHDLSATGAFFTFDRPAREGMQLYLKIDFPDRVIECVGRVARVAGSHTGKFRDVAVHISGMNVSDRKYVNDFVLNHLS